MSETAYKKSYSTLSQVLLKSNTENALINNTGNYETMSNFLALMNQFKVIKSCTTNNNSECWDSNGEQFGYVYAPGTGRPQPALYAFIDSSGVAWTLLEWQSARIAVDINGFKKPNQYGKDRFAFRLYDINSSENSGIPIKVVPWSDNNTNVCTGNVCAAKSNYYGTSWLYGK